MNIIVDKSYLQGVSSAGIKKLNSKYDTLLISYALLYEIIKSKPHKRAELFTKLTGGIVFKITPDISELNSFEISNQKSCGIPSTIIKARDYSLTEKLSEKNYEMTDRAKKAFANRALYIDILTKQMLEIIKNDFLGVTLNSSKREEIEDRIVNDKDYILGKFRTIENAKKIIFGSNHRSIISLFDKTWANYRWLQVLNLISLDINYRYESAEIFLESDKAYEKLKHDILDAEYLILALLEGAFATKEKKLIKWWELLALDPSNLEK